LNLELNLLPLLVALAAPQVQTGKPAA